MTLNKTHSLEPGSQRTIRYTVCDKDSARVLGSGLLDVYSTPAMIALMEKCSMMLVQDSLPAGYGTVGTAIDIRHLKASLIGAKLEARSKLVEIDNRRLVFEVSVSENNELIGSGIHERYIINEKNS